LSEPGQAERPARPLVAWIDSIGIVGPGFDDWQQAREVLRGEAPWQPAVTTLTLPPILPAAERRRTGVAVKVALACGHQAIGASSYTADALISVFSSSGGDGDNCHAICEALASPDRLISPTRFHNSVHNAPAGYWGIAMGARPASTSLCAHDASFAAGLLEAMTELATGRHPVVLIAYDAPYPEPLRSTRPVPHAFGAALVLAPEPTARAAARIEVTLGGEAVTRLDEPALEALRVTVPTARALPLLAAIARGTEAITALDYLDPIRVIVRLRPP
jgi:hypothetical protein